MEYEDRRAMHISSALWQVEQLRLGTQAFHLLYNTPAYPQATEDSQEEEDPCVGHGIGQPQDAAAHDGIAEVEH